MIERRVNTLMAGAMKARSTRGRYTAAGYTHAQPMYIARVPAGSAQDELLDFNRKGYRVERPWRETPVPAFGGETVAAPAPRQHVRSRAKQKSFFDRVVAQIRREKKDAMLCAFFLAIILMVGAASGQKMIQGAKLQSDISMYQSKTIALEQDNERLSQRLEIAKSGERIRNLAQNELNMLRPERALTETIYIQTIGNDQDVMLQQNEEPGMEALDILLGLLNVLHIGE